MNNPRPVIRSEKPTRILPGNLIVTLVLAFALALTLAFVTLAFGAADSAQARPGGVCKHKNTAHWGGERYHGVVYHGASWYKGRHWHKVSHYRKFGGNWRRNWTRTYPCRHSVLLSSRKESRSEDHGHSHKHSHKDSDGLHRQVAAPSGLTALEKKFGAGSRPASMMNTT